MRIPLFEMICKIRYGVGFHVCLDDISRYFRSTSMLCMYYVFAHCNLGLLMESCNFEICI